MPASTRKILPDDILSDADYAAGRAALRADIIAKKRNRRIEIGPFATFYFENYDTMWLQVMEMLRIEKGGREQIAGELEAYNPLIPQGQELIATLMLEIEDPVRRDRMLRQLGGIESTAFLDLAGERIAGTPVANEDRTKEDGKTSSVHWVRFAFTPADIEKFRSGPGVLVLGLTHPNYGHMAVVPPAVRAALAEDFV